MELLSIIETAGVIVALGWAIRLEFAVRKLQYRWKLRTRITDKFVRKE